MFLRTVTALTVLLICLTPALPRATERAAPPALHKVKKIYLAKQENLPKDVDSEVRLDRVMRKELAKYGFVVVDDRGTADAVLFGLVTEFPPVNGRAPNPPKYRYEYRLESIEGAVLWKATSSVSNRSKAVADQRGLEKIVAGLFKEWKKSAARAGVVVGNKVP